MLIDLHRLDWIRTNTLGGLFVRQRTNSVCRSPGYLSEHIFRGRLTTCRLNTRTLRMLACTAVERTYRAARSRRGRGCDLIKGIITYPDE